MQGLGPYAVFSRVIQTLLFEKMAKSKEMITRRELGMCIYGAGTFQKFSTYSVSSVSEKQKRNLVLQTELVGNKVGEGGKETEERRLCR